MSKCTDLWATRGSNCHQMITFLAVMSCFDDILANWGSVRPVYAKNPVSPTKPGFFSSNGKLFSEPDANLQFARDRPVEPIDISPANYPSENQPVDRFDKTGWSR